LADAPQRCCPDGALGILDGILVL